MFFEDIPYYTIFPEIRTATAHTVLEASDAAEFLGGSPYGLREICDLYGTKYEDIIPACTAARTGESYGMHGKIFRFALTDALRRHIVEEELHGIFGENENRYLENLRLYNGEKTVFSCLSHEVFALYHTAEIDDSLADPVLSAAKKAVTDMPLYADMRKIADRLQTRSDATVRKEIAILSDLCWYVDKEKGFWAYSPPKYKCGFASYRKIAASYLTESTYAVLAGVSSFAELQPLPVPRTVDDVLGGIHTDTPQYLCSDYYNTVKRELCMLSYIRKCREDARADGGLTPTLITSYRRRGR